MTASRQILQVANELMLDSLAENWDVYYVSV